MYGDIIPFTLVEQIYSIIAIFVGKVFLSFLFAEISSYIAQMHSTYSNHIALRKRVIRWTNKNNIQRVIKARVKSYYDILWQKFKGIDEQGMLKDLPESLRLKVKQHIFQNLLMKSEVFPKDDKGAISTIIKKLKLLIIPKNEYIIRKGEIAQEMYFIVKGQVKVLD